MCLRAYVTHSQIHVRRPRLHCLLHADCCAARCEWFKSNWNSLDGAWDPIVLLIACAISIFAISESQGTGCLGCTLRGLNN